MRYNTFKTYCKILFQKRKKSLVYLGLNSFCEVVYNLCLIYIPTLFIELIMQGIDLNILFGFFMLFTLSAIFKRFLLSKLSVEKEIQDQIMVMSIIDKMNKIPYYYLEEEDIKKKRESCLFAIQNYGAVYDLYSKCLEFVASLITIIMILGLALQSHATYVFIIIVLAFIVMLINLFLIHAKLKYSKSTIELNYAFGYYQELATQKKYQINNRIYHYADLIMKDLATLNEKTTNHFSHVRATEADYESLILVISYIQTFVSYVFPIVYLLNKQIIISQFTLLVNYGINIGKNMNSITSSFQSLIQSLDYLAPLHELMNLPEIQENQETEDFDHFESLEFRNVTFRYPNTDNNILEDISFIINKDEQVALLGLNGAGKTTIVKLIAKLYVPTKGEILVNNRNIYRYNEKYLQNISIVFQDCKIFPVTLKENIGATNDDLDSIVAACEKTNFDKVLNRKQITLQHLYNSEIYEEGVEFSGGEKQLLAITRALNRNGDFMILDEPSSALDAIMRNEILTRFKELFKGRTTLLITHDINLASLCDRVIKVENKAVTFFEKASLKDGALFNND